MTALTTSVTTAAFASGSMSHAVEVSNVGTVAGATSVLGFIASGAAGAPLRQLFAFEKVCLLPAESARVELKLPAGNPGAATVAEVRSPLSSPRLSTAIPGNP